MICFFAICATSAIFGAPSLEVGQKAPALIGDAWENLTTSKVPSLGQTQVTLVHFWTLGCSNCRNNQPSYQKLRKRFADQSFSMIGIHTPETASEADRSTLLKNIAQAHIEYPVLVDNNQRNWNAWKQRYWPTVYVIDKNNVIRGKWVGELIWQDEDGEQEVSDLIRKLLQPTVKGAKRT